MDEDELAGAALEARVELLTQQVRANPDDADVVHQLADLLERLSRFHELLALLSARVEEAPDNQRSAFVERRRGVLARMIELAEASGRADEASLYRLMLAAD